MDNLKFFLGIGLAVVLVFCGAAAYTQIVKIAPAPSYSDRETLYQVSTIDALAQGTFEGVEPVKNLKKHGDFGVGTFDALDGEMVMLDGKIYQIRADGKVYPANDSATTPFAVVTVFDRDVTIPVSRPMNFTGLTDEISHKFPSKNMIYAVRVHGTFPSVTVRSVPAQQKPYPTLAEAARNQSVFTYTNMTGTIVGFYLPDIMKGLNMPGYHLHFISDDRTKGGHLLDFTSPAGTDVELDLTPSIATTLPNTTAFSETDLSRDMSEDLAGVER
nr:acetolactate decarboxylase [uncultured Methanoregula sp.]